MNYQELSKKINDLLIVRESDGSYFLFGKYKITNDKFGFKVIKKGTDDESLVFSTLQYAVSWCVFDKNNKKTYQSRLEELDTILGSLDVAMFQHKKMLNKHRNTEDKYIFLAKLSEEKHKKKKALDEITSYVYTSKLIQDKKYLENLPK